eukprot:g68921.t1
MFFFGVIIQRFQVALGSCSRMADLDPENLSSISGRPPTKNKRSIFVNEENNEWKTKGPPIAHIVFFVLVIGLLIGFGSRSVNDRVQRREAEEAAATAALLEAMMAICDDGPKQKTGTRPQLSIREESLLLVGGGMPDPLKRQQDRFTPGDQTVSFLVWRT